MIRLFLAILLFNLVGCGGKVGKTELTYVPSSNIPKNIDVALVLGGGGARGLAHLGVLEVLEENGVKIDLIVGTSAGSLIGALYCDDPNAERVKKKVYDLKRKDFVRYSLMGGIRSMSNVYSSLVDGSVTERLLRRLLRAKTFNQLQIPFVAVVTDVCNGAPLGLGGGDVARAVRASCSVPGLFDPVIMDGSLMVDGGLTSPVPVGIAKQFNPKLIIASDVGLLPQCDINKIKNVVDLLYECIHITCNTISDIHCQEADILIKPNVCEVGMFCDNKNDEVFEAGREAALAVIDEIKERIRRLK